MTKIKFLFVLLLASLAFGSTAVAQQRGEEYPRYGFWSNWSVGGELIYNQQYTNGGLFDWRHATDAGFGLLLEKEVNHVWAVRLHGAIPGLFADETASADGTFYDRYGKLTADVKFSLNDAIHGYDPSRRGSIYLLAGAGVATKYRVQDLGMVTMLLQAGVGVSRDLGDHATLFAEYVVDDISDIPMPSNLHDVHGSFVVGFMHRFGSTRSDQELIAQRALLTQENFDALNQELSSLSGEVAAAKQQEQRLTNRINELENDLAGYSASMKAQRNAAMADSLAAVIDGIVADQLTFYALPFSVLFPTDGAVIPADQMEKVKAVARVMKDNPGMRFSVVGFCDYTGSDAYNQKLSERRAAAVKKELIRLGVEESQLTDTGKGKTAAFGDLRFGVNRRVSFYRVME